MKHGTPWSEQDVETLDRRLSEGASYRQIGLELGRTRTSVRQKVEYTRRADIGSACVQPIVIPRWVKVARDQYVNADPRDLVGYLMGDPPKGFSALDKRGA